MFRNQIIEELANRGYKAEAHEMIKNGVKMPAILIREDSTNCTPTIYTQPFSDAINNGSMTVSETVDKIIDLYENNKANVDVNKLTNRDYILENVFIGVQKTSTEDIIKADSEFEGIEKYLYVKTTVGGNSGTFKLSQQILNHVGICEAEAWQSAETHTNSDCEIVSMVKTMCELMGMTYNESMEELEGIIPMYVVSNKERVKGASAILNKSMLADFARQHNATKLIVIPSSVHEMIVVPYEATDMDIDYLNDMVREVNATQVLPQDRLTDRAYIVDVA